MHISFSTDNRRRFFERIGDILDRGHWSEGPTVAEFEARFGDRVASESVAFSSGGAALFALYEWIGVRGYDVIVPANTFWATAAAAKRAGANVIYADCNRNDLCLSLEDLKKKLTDRVKAVCVVHIGGHIAFEIDAISAFLREKGIALIEDCAHAHGASFKGRFPGSWGIGGAWSFYATKTMPMGEGGMLTSSNKALITWARHFKNYGKKVVDNTVRYVLPDGFNFRLSEFAAALGLVQLAQLDDILIWKRRLAARFDDLFEDRVRFPEGMISGYYKYIVFNTALREATGQVFAETDFGPVIEGIPATIPNSNWVAAHHACAPIWYGWPHADKTRDELEKLLLIE